MISKTELKELFNKAGVRMGEGVYEGVNEMAEEYVNGLVRKLSVLVKVADKRTATKEMVELVKDFKRR